ncbi:sugar nucleotide-binding protein [Alphaproteobacteria bacterium]|nr:sugar nucleotide-binding protein [Alphaproteobacteria bacterium]
MTNELHGNMKLFILGGSSFVGRQIMSALGPEKCCGTFHSQPFDGGIRFSLVDDNIQEILDNALQIPTHALILGAKTKIDECAANVEATDRVNVTCTIRALKAIMERGITPIFASSDAVYEGQTGNYKETDETKPTTKYGQQKSEVENFLLSQNVPSLILRLCKVLGPVSSQNDILGDWIRQFQNNQTIICAVDQRFTPIGIDDVVSACIDLANKNASGIFNLGGGESITRHELLMTLCKYYDAFCHSKMLIETCSINDLDFVEPRPLDTSVSISKLKKLIGFEPETMDSICRRAVLNYVKNGGR